MGSQSGVGLNPLPTFDWNYATSFIDPLATPLFSTIMTFAGTLTTALLTLAIYFGNAFNTAYRECVEIDRLYKANECPSQCL